MKKFIFATTLAVCVFLCFPVKAEIYLSGAFGYSDNKSDIVQPGVLKIDNMKNAPVYAFASGYEMPFFRAEAEYFSMNVKDKEGFGLDKRLKAGMVNAYLTVPFIGVYGGVGTGYAKLAGKKEQLYQAMAGWEFGVPKAAFGIEYRRTQSGKDFKNNNTELKFKADSLMLKMRFSF